MYRAFKIEESEISNLDIDASKCKSHRDHKEKESENWCKDLHKLVEEAISNESILSLSAESIWNSWFPRVKANVFISHSSKDISLANQLSFWLRENLGIASFIDSQVWGHKDELLNIMNNTFDSLEKDTMEHNSKEAINLSSNIDIILSYALTRMIDETECVIFISSKNSSTAEKKTHSPWIFHEISTVNIIQPRPRRGLAAKNFSSYELKFLIEYPVRLDRFKDLNGTDLYSWKKKCWNARLSAKETPLENLDSLYSMFRKQPVS